MDQPTLNEQYLEAKIQAKAAYEFARQEYGVSNKYAMTFAEAIGLPRMLKDPWGLSNNQISADLATTIKDNALAYAHSLVWSEIERCLSYWTEDNSKLLEAMAQVQGSKTDQELKAQIELLRANQQVIAKELQKRSVNLSFSN